MRISSSRSNVAIDFSDVEGDSFRCAVQAPDHSASRRVYAFTDRHGIVRLLEATARDWRGWDGERAWEAIEGEFRIALTTNRLGHVTVSVRLRSNAGAHDPWQLDAEVSVDAGQLEGYAKEAARLWSGSAG